MDLLFTREAVKRIIYLLLVSAIVFVTSFFLLASPNPDFNPIQGNTPHRWLLWAAFFLALYPFSLSFKHGLSLIVILGVVLLISLRFDDLASTIITTYIFLGTIIALASRMVFFPYRYRDKFNFFITVAAHHLKNLTTEVYACLTNPAYKDNLYLFEKRVHVQKMRFMKTMLALQDLINKAPATKKLAAEKTITHLQVLFDIVLDGAQLRRRVTDYNTFEICATELKAIAQELEKLFADLPAAFIKQQPLEMNELSASINQLEQTYQSVLQVSAPEPLVFLLFISSLKALCKHFEGFFRDDNATH